MVVYTDAHRLFLQVFVSKKLLSENDARKMYLMTSEKMQVDAPLDQFDDFLQTINQKLQPLYMEIRRGRAEESGETFYAMVNCFEDEHAKLATDYAPQDIEFIKKTIECVVNSSDGVVSSIEVINLGLDLVKRISNSAAEEILNKLIADGWLAECRGKISFGPRSVIELGQYLKKKYTEQIQECKLCHDFVISGDLCVHCGVKIHKYCAATTYQHLPSEKRKCVSCKDLWENDLIILPKKQELASPASVAPMPNTEPNLSGRSNGSVKRSRRR